MLLQYHVGQPRELVVAGISGEIGTICGCHRYASTACSLEIYEAGGTLAFRPRLDLQTHHFQVNLG